MEVCPVRTAFECFFTPLATSCPCWGCCVSGAQILSGNSQRGGRPTEKATPLHNFQWFDCPQIKRELVPLILFGFGLHDFEKLRERGGAGSTPSSLAAARASCPLGGPRSPGPVHFGRRPGVLGAWKVVRGPITFGEQPEREFKTFCDRRLRQSKSMGLEVEALLPPACRCYSRPHRSARRNLEPHLALGSEPVHGAPVRSVQSVRLSLCLRFRGASPTGVSLSSSPVAQSPLPPQIPRVPRGRRSGEVSQLLPPNT